VYFVQFGCFNRTSPTVIQESCPVSLCRFFVPSTDARLSFERHATSKIRKAEIYFLCIQKVSVGKHWLIAATHVEMRPNKIKKNWEPKLSLKRSLCHKGSRFTKEPHLRLKPVFQHPRSPQFLKVRYGRVSYR
jgi:hypothetical protein